MNEFEVIGRVSSLLPAAPPEVLVPIGDDCAVFTPGGERWVAAQDMLVEGRHFNLRDRASARDAGYKAVAVNVSDVAAMGATPRFVLLSGGAPDSEVALECFEGALEACEEFGVYPLGGDTTRAEALTVDVSILGSLAGDPVLRSGARAGDLLAVTGELGASAAGLLALEERVEGFERLKERHLRPRPRVEEGKRVAELGARAMIDLSDGLASDAAHVASVSGVGCRIDLGSLPVAEDTRALSLALGRDALALAASGGEDYELMICASRGVLEALRNATHTPLTVLGEVVASEGAGFVEFTLDGVPVADLSGYDHFA